MSCASTLITALTALGCGHTVCQTDADCPSDAVCNAQACTKKSGPRPTPPAECGDRCEIDRMRCEYGEQGLTTSNQRCEIGNDGCSKWTTTEACGTTKYCQEGSGCVPYLAENAPCGDQGVCGGDFVCTSIESLTGGAGAQTCIRACVAGACDGGQTCVRDICVAASYCDGCNTGDLRCGPGGPQICATIDDPCARWTALDACTGSDTCEAGACVGTVQMGGACSPSSNCARGLVCLDGPSRCEAICTTSAQCGASGCRPTAASRGYGVCAAGDGPRVEATCVITAVSGQASGDHDPATPFTPSSPPDPFVVISGGGYYLASGAFQDVSSASWNVSTPDLLFTTVLDLTVAIWDDDSPFTAPDLVAEWRLADQFAWTSATRSFDLTLESGGSALGLQIRCTDR